MNRNKGKSVAVVYGAKIERGKEGKYEVSFRDVNGAVTFGDTFEEAVFNASEALDGVLAGMLDVGEAIPAPTSLEKGEVGIPVGLTVAAPVVLNITRVSAGLTMAAAARSMGVTYQRYQQLERPGGNLTMKTMQAAAAAMGAVVELRVTPVQKLRTA